VSEGTALMQDLTGAAKSVLPSTIPDSGTAGRLLSTSPLAGALSTMVGLPLAPIYSKAGHSFTQGLMGYRPKSLQMAGDLIEKTQPMAAPVATSMWDDMQ